MILTGTVTEARGERSHGSLERRLLLLLAYSSIQVVLLAQLRELGLEGGPADLVLVLRHGREVAHVGMLGAGRARELAWESCWEAGRPRGRLDDASSPAGHCQLSRRKGDVGAAERFRYVRGAASLRHQVPEKGIEGVVVRC